MKLGHDSMMMTVALLAGLGVSACDDGSYGDDGGDAAGQTDDGADGADDGADEADDGADGADDGADGADGADDAADDSPAGDDGDGALSFAVDILPIIVASCGCHTGGAPSAGLDLNEDAAFASLQAASTAGIPYVTPGDSGQSYLVHKLDGTMAEVGGGGARMPMGGQLADVETDTIVDWIDAGAPE